ncbi:MAG: hypothetical protein HYZ49_03830 [Chloroflexi bacterium]|nr:hypothetical protein [Chloroflexota bacterium]
MSEETQPSYSRRNRIGQAAVPLWALGFLAALFAVTCLSLWAVILVSRPTLPRVTAVPEFIIVSNTSTPFPGSGQASPTELPTLEPPTPTVPPNVNPGVINLGSFVQVVRTDGDPLKLRQAPSLSGEVNYLALPSEVLKVANGPTIADGFTWWFLVDPADENRNGWAVENYLEATTGP